MSEQLTKQEMAEWLAENVLGWEKLPTNVTKIGVRTEHFEEIETGLTKTIDEMLQFIYSPDGFFAVIGELSSNVKFELTSLNNLSWNKFLYSRDYHAFYNAVYEAMK